MGQPLLMKNFGWELEILTAFDPVYQQRFVSQFETSNDFTISRDLDFWKINVYFQYGHRRFNAGFIYS